MTTILHPAARHELSDVRLDEPEILVHTSRDLGEDIGDVLVTKFVGLIDGATHTLAIGGQHGRECDDMITLIRNM